MTFISDLKKLAGLTEVYSKKTTAMRDYMRTGEVENDPDWIPSSDDELTAWVEWLREDFGERGPQSALMLLNKHDDELKIAYEIIYGI